MVMTLNFRVGVYAGVFRNGTELCCASILTCCETRFGELLSNKSPANVDLDLFSTEGRSTLAWTSLIVGRGPEKGGSEKCIVDVSIKGWNSILGALLCVYSFCLSISVLKYSALNQGKEGSKPISFVIANCSAQGRIVTGAPIGEAHSVPSRRDGETKR